MAQVLPDSDSEDELPPGWEERTTDDGNVYYVKPSLLYRSESWVDSGYLIHNLEVRDLKEARMIDCITSHSTQGTQWTHPRTGKKKIVSGDLPFGWEKNVSEDGKIFFVDHSNRRTTYTDPRLAFATEEKDHPHDFRQRFDGSTSALQILHGRDLTGKVAIVTGANTGIGYETARSLAFHGCTVVFACRSVSKAQEAIERIKSERPNTKCDALELDLASLRSVKTFATTFMLQYRCLDMLILNAGVFGAPFTQTEDGYELTFQVNHLSHFYLTLLLEPVLPPKARVVVVSSESHRFANLSVGSLSESVLSPCSASQYWSMMAYNNSKLCNVLFATELGRRWEKKGICVNSLHPGNLVSSDISRHWWFYRLLFALVRPFTKSLQQAASTTVYCATAVDLENVSGLYFNNCCRCEPSAASQDRELSNLLWKFSEQMIEKTLGEGAFSSAKGD